ncbi:hypothetical protein [Nocardioides sp.]|uniref:hypothetical protein n=1 Tax=Nocardioides sp. TaxID=35761 RepID=UPI0026250AA3|nr:hypothetical protein [Nocardioides sp.]MDI6911459.1 hypothetical protein [Nocardioides sp.]
MSNLFDDQPKTPAAADQSGPRDAIAFLLWVVEFTALTIAPAVVYATWRWFL